MRIEREGDDRLRFLDGERSLGVVRFIHLGAQWVWIEGEGEETDPTLPIPIDQEATDRFIAELQSIAKQDLTLQAIAQVEWDGRVRMFRDETADMAVLFGRVQARRQL